MVCEHTRTYITRHTHTHTHIHTQLTCTGNILVYSLYNRKHVIRSVLISLGQPVALVIGKDIPTSGKDTSMLRNNVELRNSCPLIRAFTLLMASHVIM